LEVTNIGNRAGVDVVQLYLRDLVGEVTRPIKELKGYKRIHLEPGKTEKVVFKIHRDDLAYYGLDERLRIDPGQYHIWIGPDCSQGLKGEFKLI